MVLCPSCDEYVRPDLGVCPNCGYVFKEKKKRTNWDSWDYIDDRIEGKEED